MMRIDEDRRARWLAGAGEVAHQVGPRKTGVRQIGVGQSSGTVMKVSWPAAAL